MEYNECTLPLRYPFDNFHFVSSVDGEGGAVGFHVVEEHECFVEKLVSQGLPHGICLVIV